MGLPSKLFLIVIFIGSIGQIWTLEWVNPLGGMLSRSCLYGFGISALRSEFDRGKKDRQWEIKCSRVGTVPHGQNCVWTKNFVNRWNEKIHFMCNTSSVGFEGYLSGLYSDQNDDTSGDRQWRVECCTSNGVENDACVETDYANNYEKPLNFPVPPGKILHGIISDYDNFYADRKWRFVICDINISKRRKANRGRHAQDSTHH